MKNALKVIIPLMIVFVILGGCSTPSSGSNNSQQSKTESNDGIPFDIGSINDVYVSVDDHTEDWKNGTDDDGYFYQFWKDKEDKGMGENIGTAYMDTYTNGFNAAWNGVHGVVCGKGWSTGTKNLVVNYTGSVSSSADQAGVDDDYYMGLYGWADAGWDENNPNPLKLIEYYIVEQHGDKDHGLDYDGDQGFNGAQIVSDGCVYKSWKTRRVNKPSIKGYTDFDQYWSVNKTPRNSGTINFALHVLAWKFSGWVEFENWMMDDTNSTYQLMFLEAPYDDNTGTGGGSITINSSNRPPAQKSIIKKGLSTQLSGKFLTVVDDPDPDFADIICKDENPSWDSQVWTFEETSSSNEGRLKNFWTGRYLTVTDDPNPDFAPVKAQPLNTGWDSQVWIIEDAYNSFRLKNKWTGRYLTVTGDQEDAAVVCQPLHYYWSSQKWNVE